MKRSCTASPVLALSTTATSCRSTAAPSSTGGTAMPRHRWSSVRGRLRFLSGSITEEALWRGLAQAVVGGRLSDIGHAIETYVHDAGDFGIVEEYVGHGIGTAMHMEPSVPNYGQPGHGPHLETGMALAVEPMVNLGGRHTRLLDDDWTVVTLDGQWSAHFEHTVAITEQGPWVLTAHDGGAARFSSLDIPTPASGGTPSPSRS